MRIIIAGGRDFDDYELLKERCDHLLQNVVVTDFISGGCIGADKLGERYARERGIEPTIFPANWNKYGLGAGPKRNEQMAQNADGCILFWNGRTPGSSNMKKYCIVYGLKLKEVDTQKTKL